MKSEQPTAKAIMSSNVVTIHFQMSIREALEVLSEERISGAPVVDESGKPVGVISVTDVVAYQAGRKCGESGAFYSTIDTEGFMSVEDLEGTEEEAGTLDSTPVSRAMTPNIISVKPSTDLRQIAGVMVKERIHRVLVMDRGKVVGLVSSMDVLRTLAGAQRKPIRKRR